MKIRDVLAINLKYYRKKLNLPQEKFAEVIGTSLSYLNQIENKKVDVRSSTNFKKSGFKILLFFKLCIFYTNFLIKSHINI